MSRNLWFWTAIAITLSIPAHATDAPTDESGSPWSGSLGLAYLATSGNTNTSSLGFELKFEREPRPWGLRGRALTYRAREDDKTTAERYLAGLRTERAFEDRWSVFAGASGERDRFKGINLRSIVEAGGLYHALLGPRHNLSFDAGVTWTWAEDVRKESVDSVGLVAGVSYSLQLSENAELTERFIYYPNLDESDDWRYRSETALTAKINTRWAIKLGYLITYDNLPVEGFEKRDTTSSASIVMSF